MPILTFFRRPDNRASSAAAWPAFKVAGHPAEITVRWVPKDGWVRWFVRGASLAAGAPGRARWG